MKIGLGSIIDDNENTHTQRKSKQKPQVFEILYFNYTDDKKKRVFIGVFI